MEFVYDVKIPKDRIAVLIGTKGNIKKQIEEETKCKINVNSKEGEVRLTSDDSLALFLAKDVVKAIARGFNPQTAQLVLKTYCVFELLTITDYVSKSKSTIERLKGRVIGEGGKARHQIETLTSTHISVYGKTIGIIGETEHAALARSAIESLLSGSTHATVYRFLERKKKELERQTVFGNKIELKEGAERYL
ncbi:RNA-processing protein [Candidatus Woesearchaeota archaeon]|nr:RNA-processing protein [Candidatus Woesearchaeota archaeon]